MNLNRNFNWNEICKQVPADIAALLTKIQHLVSKICGTFFSSTISNLLRLADLFNLMFNYNVFVHIAEGQPSEVINELSVYILRLVIQEKVVSQKTMNELRQLLGTADQKSIKDIIQVKINVIRKFY